MERPNQLARLTGHDQVIVKRCQAATGANSCSLGETDFLIKFANEHFLVWFPQGIPAGQSVAIASSRIGKQLDEQADWFDALRTIAVQLAGSDNFLVTSKKVTTDIFVREISRLFGIPVLDFKPFPNQTSADWFGRQANIENDDRLTRTAWFKQLDLNSPSRSLNKTSTNKFNVNDLLISISKVAVLLSVRKSGNIFKAVSQRLAIQKENTGMTKLLVNRSLTPKSVEATLLDRSATAWWLYRNGQETDEAHHDRKIRSDSFEDSTRCLDTQPPEIRILSLDEIKADQYLLHWTRRRVGPWPDQSTPEFIEDLIFQTTRRQHSALSSLCRILAARKILGSSDITRDRRAVVCFSNLPVDQLSNHRVFRPHLSRWDFELFGIAIDRDWLVEQGTKPVIYGDDERWSELTDSEQPFFQVEKTRSGKIDWQGEQEWRAVGDLNLEKIPADRAFIFVPSEADAQVVAGLCHWPIVILNPDG